MARYGRGLICLTLTRDRCRQLRLPLMVSETDADQTTNFTLSIEAAEGVTTGISAYDRAHTIRTAVAPDARPEHLRQPGHIFPLMAQPGGVLTRAGHTEAGCDLVRISGLEPAAVIVEILNEDGTMARRPQLEEFAKLHGLKIGTIADLIRYRLEKERSVERIAERRDRDRIRAVPPVLLRRPREQHRAPRARPRVARAHVHAAGARAPEGYGARPRRCRTSRATAGRCAARSSAIARDGDGRRRAAAPAREPARDRRGGPHRRSDAAQPARDRRAGAAHLRHRRADPARPRRDAHARAERAEADARAFGIRPRSRPSTSTRPAEESTWTTSAPSMAT